MEVECFLISQSMITDYKWKRWPKKIEKKFRSKEAIDVNEREYLLEIDLQYPQEIHEQQGDFPIALSPLMLSSKQGRIVMFGLVVLKKKSVG